MADLQTQNIQRTMLESTKNMDTPITGAGHVREMWNAVNDDTRQPPSCWRTTTTSADGTTTMTEPSRHTYMAATIVVYVLGFYHVAKVVFLLGAVPYTEATTRDMIISIVCLLGLYIFLVDLHNCRVYEGLLRLIFILFLANMLLPCVWQVHPKKAELDEEDEIIDMDGQH